MTDETKTPDDDLPDGVGPVADPSPTAPAKGSRPSRAKRHLALVHDVEMAGENKAKGKGADVRSRVKRSAPDPVTGLTEKQELFAQCVIGNITDQDGNHMSLSDSYRHAYDTSGMTAKSVHEESCRLFADHKVASRLKSLAQEKEDNRRMLAAKDAELALGVFRKLASKADTDASKIRAAELLAKASGVFTEKVEFEDKTDRSVSDIEQSIKERLARLGLTG